MKEKGEEEGIKREGKGKTILVFYSKKLFFLEFEDINNNKKKKKTKRHGENKADQMETPSKEEVLNLENSFEEKKDEKFKKNEKKNQHSKGRKIYFKYILR